MLKSPLPFALVVLSRLVFFSSPSFRPRHLSSHSRPLISLSFLFVFSPGGCLMRRTANIPPQKRYKHWLYGCVQRQQDLCLPSAFLKSVQLTSLVKFRRLHTFMSVAFLFHIFKNKNWAHKFEFLVDFVLHGSKFYIQAQIYSYTPFDIWLDIPKGQSLLTSCW